jgi:hypothetical protein
MQDEGRSTPRRDHCQLRSLRGRGCFVVCFKIQQPSSPFPSPPTEGPSVWVLAGKMKNNPKHATHPFSHANRFFFFSFPDDGWLIIPSIPFPSPRNGPG